MAEERIKSTSRPRSAGTEFKRAKGRKGGAAPGSQPDAATKESAKDAAAQPQRDTVREVLETVVFVVILVLLLKTFVAEAFVIPTGSMADTLFGHHRKVDCPQCKYNFPVNFSSEVEADPSRRFPVESCVCPNCRVLIRFDKKTTFAAPR